MPDAVLRPTARVLLVDERDRTLLFRGLDDAEGATAFWFPPGGEVEPGETHEQAALRELHEETGLALATPGPHVFDRRHQIVLAGVPTIVEEVWFFARCRPFAIDTTGFTPLERATIPEHRWWSLSALERAEERLVPIDLAARVRSLLADGPPAPPLRLGV